MGKKRVITKTKEELLKERDRVEASVRKEIKIKTPQRIREGRIYIYSSYNNTILTLTDPQGNVTEKLFVAWITMNNPKQFNSYTTDMVKGVIAGFENASLDRSVVAVVFTGIVTFNEKIFFSISQPLLITPYIDLKLAFTNVKSPTGSGRRIICLNPGCALS